jgi:hypothetical protein
MNDKNVYLTIVCLCSTLALSLNASQASSARATTATSSSFGISIDSGAFAEQISSDAIPQFIEALRKAIPTLRADLDHQLPITIRVVTPELLAAARQALPALRADIDQQLVISIQNARRNITPITDEILKKTAFTLLFVVCATGAAACFYSDSVCSPKFVIFTLAAILAYKQAFGH